ncbi:signal transduction histidine kinase [Filimonas zeae]|uniref:histidine kinase n=1 Tax=Filimonas zeae TaxID=1737353 RepID=A0A917IXU1_9BACT|nr:HAMP domain-containing sensor histidine kinase [Filimonas zeae]MDR6338900.1 signal transduction histidine kinase [Filimonas zeae]GGH66058.1 hypothetical protein GCM10011379_19830 [Filimonas zeae]
MRTRFVYKPVLEKTWKYLIGDAAEFAPEEQSFHGICVLSFAILLFLLPFNAIIGLWNVCVMMAVLLLLIALFYYQARFKHRHLLGIVSYAVASYITLIINYLFNAGSLGPTLFLFLLTFQLLIAFSKRQLHLVWFCTHLCITAALLVMELWYPRFVPYTYDSKQSRFIDVISSFLIILVCMYFVTIYLRNKYNTERKVAEEQAAKILLQNRQLELLNLQKNKLFSVMAHDLRGPFNSIGQVVDMLDNQELTPEDHALFMGHLKEFTVSTSDMLSNLLSWSYSQLQGMRVKLISLPVKKAVEEVAATQRAFADNKGIALMVDIEDTHVVLADQQMLEIVLRNLINNAIKFTPAGGSIQVHSQLQQHYCVIHVQDTGIGLAPEAISQLFTFNLSSTRGTGNEKGLGLGLHLCREFMELQYGSITVTSRPGAGSTFTIRLPLANA